MEMHKTTKEEFLDFMKDTYWGACLECCDYEKMIGELIDYISQHFIDKRVVDETCVCGEEICIGGAEVEIGGICHRLDNPCYTISKIDEPTAQRQVSFFLRLHRHLPDNICGSSPISSCNYRKDGEAINWFNDYVEELQKDPEFVKKEKEVEEAVKNGKRLYNK